MVNELHFRTLCTITTEPYISNNCSGQPAAYLDFGITFICNCKLRCNLDCGTKITVCEIVRSICRTRMYAEYPCHRFQNSAWRLSLLQMFLHSTPFVRTQTFWKGKINFVIRVSGHLSTIFVSFHLNVFLLVVNESLNYCVYSVLVNLHGFKTLSVVLPSPHRVNLSLRIKLL